MYGPHFSSHNIKKKEREKREAMEGRKKLGRKGKLEGEKRDGEKKEGCEKRGRTDSNIFPQKKGILTNIPPLIYRKTGCGISVHCVKMCYYDW